jgi:hypothetical protein
MGKSQLLMMITMERWLFMPLLWWDNQWEIMVKHGSLIDY